MDNKLEVKSMSVSYHVVPLVVAVASLLIGSTLMLSTLFGQLVG